MRCLILPLMILALLVQGPIPTCEEPSRTLRSLEVLPPVRDPSIPYEERIGPLRGLAEKNPDDFFIQRFYQDAFRRSFYLADEYDRALALYRRRPDNLLSRYFEARLLLNVEPERSQRTFADLMARTPSFVWPHLDLIELATLPGRRDPATVESHVKAFLRICSEIPDAYARFDLVEDKQLVRKGAEDLRRGLERRNTPLDLQSWPNLWSLEGRTGLAPDELRSHVRRDLKRIESWPLRPTPEILSVYRQASDLLKDPAVFEEFEAKVAREAPRSGLMQFLVKARWSRENPRPPRDASLDEQRAHREKEIQAEAGWRQRWAADLRLNVDHLRRLTFGAMPGDGVPLAEVLAVADRTLRCLEDFPDAGVGWPPFQTNVAELYVKHRARLEEVPKLLDAGLQAVEKQEKYRLSRELIPNEQRDRLVENKELTYWRTQQIRADYLLAVNRTSEARAVIEQEMAKLESARPGPDAPARFRSQRNQWLQRLGTVAEKEGRIDDALALYQSSLEGLSKQVLADTNNEAVEAVKRFYLDHGGTEEKWLDWAGAGRAQPAALAPMPVQFVAPLPDFSVKDLAGRAWSLPDLKGKATFLNFWATWCGPCRAEHPQIQKLHEIAKGRQDVQVLTIDVDANPTLVMTYMKEKGYTFPVIHAPALADRLFPYVGLPTNLLVNGKGWRTGMYPFRPGPEGAGLVLADLTEAATTR